MAKYATIEMNTGYVWWSGEASSAIDACKASDLEGNNESREFAEITRGEYEHADYAVYSIPDSLVIDDGQDRDQIKAVESGQFVTYCAAINTQAGG